MKIAEGVYVLPIPRNSQGAAGFLNLTLILDEQNGNTLVDAGLPGQAEAIGAALAEAGTGVRDLRRIIFTHQHLDHIGSGAALVRQSGARVPPRSRSSDGRSATGVTPALSVKSRRLGRRTEAG